MKKLLIFLVSFCLLLPLKSAQAEVGLHLGMGVPFISQFGLDLTMGPSWSLTVGNNNLSLESGEASLDLNMPSAIINWHPFAGAFYIGVGFGRETLTVEAKDELLNASAKAEVTANTTLARLGWMWGKGDGGFWFGMDLTFVSPSGGDVDVETVGFTATDEEYKDVEEAGEEFGKTAYTNITFARLGYLF